MAPYDDTQAGNSTKNHRGTGDFESGNHTWECARKTYDTLRSPRAETFMNLCRLVAKELQIRPVSFDQQDWVGGLDQSQWAAALGVSVDTFKRVYTLSPLRHEVRQNAATGRKELLLGVGQRFETPRTVAKRMQWTWRDTGLKAEPWHFGYWVGLAKDWPHGHQSRLLRHAITNWEEFCAAMKLEIEIALRVIKQRIEVSESAVWEDHTLATAFRVRQGVVKASSLNPKRFYKYPSPSVIRTFPHIAEHLYFSHPDIVCPVEVDYLTDGLQVDV
ncbi:hypothetical protein [Tateyamaria sp. SN6-1]|uniref:hypothetical protein n=1 Tax=Tateyamaria sp. SN6-1 TaxID=3092148 RepID=UPI0039F47F02